jgi:HEAT repeats
MHKFLTFVAVTVSLCMGTTTRGAQSTSGLSERTLRLIQGWTEEAENFVSSNRADGSGRVSMLIDLLDRGNRIIELTLRESNGSQGVGEGFGGIYSEILGALWKSSARDNQQVLDVLARGSYNADSPFAVEIARSYGERIAPTVLEQARSDVSIFRATATQMLGTLLQYSKLLPTTRDSVHTAIVNAASDKDVGVRISAVITLGQVGTPVDLTLLQRLAVNDPETMTANNSIRYPVRDAAQRAIAAIQRR